MLNRFRLTPERYGQTDRQTDRFAISISRVSMLTRDKNGTFRKLEYRYDFVFAFYGNYKALSCIVSEIK